MQRFKILTLGNFVSNPNLLIVLETFAHFYSDLTPKNKKKSNLIIIDEISGKTEVLKLAKQLKIEPAISFINIEDQTEVENAYHSADLYFNTNLSSSIKHFRKALSFHLPILSFYAQELEEVVDRSCGFLVRAKFQSTAISEFCTFLQMLYFDPLACSILKEGAKKKYDNLYELRA